MIHETLSHLFDRIAMPLVTGTGVVGGMVLATASDGDTDIMEWAERFGLPVVLLFLVIFALSKILPPIVQWHLKHIDDTNKTFVAEIQAEREARERNLRDFREMLHSHKGDLSADIEKVNETLVEGNRLTGELVKQLADRPCQIPNLRQKTQQLNIQ